MAFPNYVGLEHRDSHKVSSTRIGNIRTGTIGMTPDGNLWRYCKADSTQIAAGLFCCSITTPTNEQTVTVAHAIGVETVEVTAAGISANDFQDGILVVTAGTGAGEVHAIKSNTATGDPSTGTINVTFYEGDGLKVAWSTTDTDVDLFKAPYETMVFCATDGQQLAVCLTQGIIPASNFFWGLAKGFGAVMMDNAASAAGLEADEKNVVQSLTHEGQGFIDNAPDATAILAGYRQVLGYLVTEEDVVNDEMELVKVDVL